MKKWITILVAAAMIAALAVPSFAMTEQEEHAARQPDYSRSGSIAVDIKTAAGEKVGGGQLTVYPVALAEYDNGDNIFEYTEAFRDCGLDLSVIDEQETGAHELAAQLVPYAAEGTTVDVDGNGHADFTGLELGLYLIVQETPADEYEPIKPFLVTVPMWDGEKLVYDVEAKPKPGTAVGLTKYSPEVEKVVSAASGAAPEDAEFVFRMTPGSADCPMPANTEGEKDEATGAVTLKKTGAGTWTFGDIYFELDDAGKTYTYTIEEVAGTDSRFTYDKTVYTLSVTVNRNEETGDLTLDVSCTDAGGKTADHAKFTNIFDPPPKLPQTGQLWWPVPVLAGVGLVIFLLGWNWKRKET